MCNEQINKFPTSRNTVTTFQREKIPSKKRVVLLIDESVVVKEVLEVLDDNLLDQFYVPHL